MYEYKIKNLVEVIDGDTVDIEIDLGFDVTIKQRLRLQGIDSPESRTRDLTEKELGLKAKAWLSKKLKQSNLIVQTIKLESSEKYGRMLGVIYKQGEEISINEQMINEGYAWFYDGGEKKKDLNLLINKQKR
jgi:micrococcal nuclease